VPLSAARRAIAFLSDVANRGLFLDILVFLLNLWLMPQIVSSFSAMMGRAAEDDSASMNAIFIIALALFVLAPVGATLKRWRHHEHMRGSKSPGQPDPLASCWFNPIFYFCLTAIIFSTISAFALEKTYGRQEPNAGVFVTSLFLGIGLMITHTVLVYRYFSPPKSAPRNTFLLSRNAEIIGDACLFANMFIFQLIWNSLTSFKPPPPTGAIDIVFRFAILLFVALLLYFPPRMFYLADDIGKRRTWVSILVANLPLIIRLLIGSGAGAER
jgi:hypothetical protein